MPFAGRRHAIVDRPRSSYAVEPIARPPSGRPPDDETRIFLDRCAHGWNFSREKHAARGQGPMVLKATRPQGPMVPNQGPMVLKAAIPQGPMVLKPTKPRENAERTAFIKAVTTLVATPFGRRFCQARKESWGNASSLDCRNSSRDGRACAGWRSSLSRSSCQLPSSSGLGRRPLTAKTGVRVP